MSRISRQPSCLLCSSRRAKLLLVKFERSLLRCLCCGLVYAFPQPEPAELLSRYNSPLFFDAYLRTMRASRETFDLDYVKSHFRLFLDFIEPFFFPGAKLLDVGCGAGFFLRAALEQGWQGEGVEISDLAANYAEEVVKVPVWHGSLESLFLPSASYDLVVMLDLLEHLPDPRRALIEAHRLLKKNGILLVTTPDFFSLNRFFLGSSWAVLNPGEHLFCFSQRTLQQLARLTGWSSSATWNLFVCNPAYLHGRPRALAQVWIRLHRWLEKQSFMKNLHGFEYLELLKLSGRKLNLPELNRVQKIRRAFYRRMKPWLRGDILCLVARK